ncbi:arylsulfotransferase (asst) [Halobacteriaceae archaeon GCM10025711]
MFTAFLIMPAKTALRASFVVLLVLSTLTLGVSYATTALDDTTATVAAQRYADGSDEPIVEPRDNVTVVATDSNTWLGEETDDPRSKAELVAFDPDGSVLYYNDSHTRYWDVDPVPGTATTVEYAFSDHLSGSACPTDYDPAAYGVNESVWNEYEQARADTDACTLNGVERVNLTTGELTRVWSQVTPGKEASRHHDVDRINETHLAVADIYLDRVFVVNTDTGEMTWSWNASSDFPRSGGGPYPVDWTHVNDVEVLPDGRLMADLRNQDQVVFLDPTEPSDEALQENWTLGAEDDYDVLYEQHNPDYIPREQGGPAVVIGDSENNRVVEYQRTGDGWERTWTWQDARMQWARDADRLPNGHTLVADSNGDRVLEIDRSGDVVWSANIGFPYEVERLGTGDESAGGPSATSADIASSRGSGPLGALWVDVKGSLSGPVFSATQYILPEWMGFVEFGAVVLFALTALAWGATETWWVARRRFRRR